MVRRGNATSLLLRLLLVWSVRRGKERVVARRLLLLVVVVVHLLLLLLDDGGTRRGADGASASDAVHFLVRQLLLLVKRVRWTASGCGAGTHCVNAATIEKIESTLRINYFKIPKINFKTVLSIW